MKNENAEANYKQFSNSPDRIDGSVHNKVVARLGTAFDYREMEPLAAIEIAFTVEPHGNIRSMMVVDMAAARALRDQLDEMIKEHALIPPVQTGNDDIAPTMPTSFHDRFNA